MSNDISFFLNCHLKKKETLLYWSSVLYNRIYFDSRNTFPIPVISDRSLGYTETPSLLTFPVLHPSYARSQGSRYKPLSSWEKDFLPQLFKNSPILIASRSSIIPEYQWIPCLNIKYSSIPWGQDSNYKTNNAQRRNIENT